MDDEKIYDRIESVRVESKGDLKDIEGRIGNALDRVREESARGNQSLEVKLDRLGDRLLQATREQTDNLREAIATHGKKLEVHEALDLARFADTGKKINRVYNYIYYAAGAIAALMAAIEGIRIWVDLRK